MVIGGIQEYMCKAKCPCDPRGLKNLERWTDGLKFTNQDKDIYFFTGTFTNYYQCYQSLVKKDQIDEEHIISQKTLVFIQDFEENLSCAGICQAPDFWFY